MNLLRVICSLLILVSARTPVFCDEPGPDNHVSGRERLEQSVALYMVQAVMVPQNYDDLNLRIRAQLFLGEDAPIDLVGAALQKHSDDSLESEWTNIEVAYTAAGYSRILRSAKVRLDHLLSVSQPGELYRGIPLKPAEETDGSVIAAIDLLAVNQPADKNTVNKQLYIRLRKWQQAYTGALRSFAVWFIQTTSNFNTEERALLLQEIQAGELYSPEEVEGLSNSLLLMD